MNRGRATSTGTSDREYTSVKDEVVLWGNWGTGLADRRSPPQDAVTADSGGTLLAFTPGDISPRSGKAAILRGVRGAPTRVWRN